MKAINGFISALILGTLADAFGGFSYASGIEKALQKVEIADEQTLQVSKTPSSKLHLNGDPLFLPGNAKPEFNPDGDSLILFAGNDTTVCLSGPCIEVSGFAQNYYYTSWATAGDGFFAQATELNTQYFPGPQDIANGLADIYLVGICVQPDYLRIVDSVKIALVHTPECFAGVDASVCSGDVFQTEAEASWYSQVLWGTSGDGTFDQDNMLLPKYQHGPEDLDNNHVLLEITAFPMEPCQVEQSNQMTLHIKQSPGLNAGNDTILCEDNPLQLDAEITHGNEILWMTNGDGTFSDLSVANPLYTPGPGDVGNGGTMLSIIVTPGFPCEAFATDNLELEIVSHPNVNVGNDQTICENDVVQCFSVVENYDHLLWSVLGGDGFFADSSAMNTVYYPGAHEKSTGICYITLSVHANDPCNSVISAFFKVELENKATILAGADQDICSNDTAMLYGMGEQYEDVFWETSGDGTFIGGEYLSRKYIPGPQDMQTGTTEIFLCASSMAPCDELVCDTINLQIEYMATADAGADDTICAGTLLSGEAENYLQVFWTTSGDGTFDEPNDLTTNYYAGDSDIENLTVTLTLYAEPLAPCEGLAVDEKNLTIDRPVLISSEMTDQEVFAGDSAGLAIAAASLQGVTYQWFHDGEPLGGATTPELDFEYCQPTDAGRYFCVYGNDCFSFHSDTALITIFAPSNQVIGFGTGWNAVSSYVAPANAEIEVVLSPILDELVILYSDDGIFYPGQEVQTFSNWSSNTGYILKTTADNNLTINGYVKYPADVIELDPGWSVLPAALACPLNPVDLFAEFTEIKAVKEIGGFRIYWPEMGIFTLQNINPGKAYEVFNASADTISFTFPGCDE